MESRPETTYLKTGDVLVTNARVVIGSTTYALANVTSVSSIVIPPDRSQAEGRVGCAAVMGLALCAIVASSGLVALAVVLLLVILVAAFVAGRRIKANPTYVIRLGSSSGESEALRSDDKDRIAKIVDAVNAAIISRG